MTPNDRVCPTQSFVGAVALATSSLLAACGSGPQERSTLVRDSAGIAILENVLPEDATGLAWRVSPDPVVTIGRAEGGGPHQLYNVRAATRFSDGAVAVVNGGTEELRVFEPSGEPRGVVGGSGGGPGEFGAMVLVGLLPGDSVLLHDPAAGRFSVVTDGPAFARSFQPSGEIGSGGLSAVGLLGDGRIVVKGPLIRTGQPVSGSILDTPRPLMVLEPHGKLDAVLDTVGTRPMLLEIGDGFNLTRVPFRIEPKIAVGTGRIHVGTGEAYEIRSYDPAGSLVRIVRLDRSPRAVTAADVERVVEENVARADPARRQALRSRYERMTMPDVMPAHNRLRVDAASNLWVEDYRAAAEEPKVWTVFGPEGRVLGKLEMPARIDYVFEIGHDWILGLRRDELDIQYVVLHTLEK